MAKVGTHCLICSRTSTQRTRMNAVQQIAELFRQRGDSLYGGECVTQAEHALQAAWLAEQEGADAALITAALLHDIGHLLHELPADAPEQGIDDRHENAGYHWVARWFDAAVAEPVRLHVAAKRYLCTVDTGYFDKLSPPSVQSLHLQGGLMSAAERVAFEQLPYWRAAVRLRRWDDIAKIADLKTPPLEHFLSYAEHVARQQAVRD